MRRPRKSVVAARQDADAALQHFQRLDRDLELAVIAHLLRHFRRQAPFGRACEADQPRKSRRDEVLVLVGFQHVERFFVGKARVIDHLDAMADALLDRFGRARVRCDALAEALGLGHAHRNFSPKARVRSPVMYSPDRLILI